MPVPHWTERTWSVKVEGTPEVLDTGPNRRLEVRNDGSDVAWLSTSPDRDGRSELLVPGETVTLRERRFAWSPSRARLHVRDVVEEAAA